MDTSRRSSRAARASHPLQSASHHSSASSNSSGRAERATRSHNKAESPRKSTPSGSLSSELLDDAVASVEDSIQTRRKRGRGEEQTKSAKAQTAQIETPNGVDEGGDDDEAVRCICGLDEYPGPPQLLDEDNKNGIKEGIEGPSVPPADYTDDVAGFFLQCDVCKVWQHGGCVGIMNEDQSPDEYFCEECRADLHKIYKAPNGQHYSHYIPLYQSLSRTTSQAASFSKDGTRSPRGSRSGRPSSSTQGGKRRSTMNSRDAAYDAEAEFQKAIEASKAEKGTASIDDGGIRRVKRGRSDSEEKPEGPKRQRTASLSPSPSHEQPQLPSQPGSDDGANGRSTGAKKIRGAAARNHKEKELREERERSRQEAASKRSKRAEQRRVEDSDPSEELPLAARATVKKAPEAVAEPLDPPPSSQPAPTESPPPVPPPISHKKGGRPPNARKGKLGKNQYTKDRDNQDRDDATPNRSQSRDIPRQDDTGHEPGSKPLSTEVKPPRSKGPHSKITLTDMKKKVERLLNFIAKTQRELADESMSAQTQEAAGKMLLGIAEGIPGIRLNANSDTGDDSSAISRARLGSPPMDFRDLTCIEMMDVLTRRLVKWQQEFA